VYIQQEPLRIGGVNYNPVESGDREEEEEG
jgi:hypothetical protein